jgi:hypothetical protein
VPRPFSIRRCAVCMAEFMSSGPKTVCHCSSACFRVTVTARKQAERRILEAKYSEKNPPLSGCRWIAVTSGAKRFVFSLIDEDAFDEASTILWHLSTMGYVFTRNTPGKVTIHLHHIAFGEKPVDGEIDHINRDSLDNRRSNLRLATHAQNMWNMAPRPNREGFIGIRRQRGMKAWIARIAYNGSRLYLGQFETPEEAARAYDEAVLRLHGEFAKVKFNLPSENK